MPGSGAKEKTAENGGQGRLWGRLSNWWHDGKAAGETAGDGGGARRTDISDDDGTWSPMRLWLLQELFGDGHTTPAADVIQPKLFRPLHLDGESRVLEIGAGLGAVGAALHGQTGARVDSYTDEVELIDHAAAWLDSHAPEVKIERRELHDTGPKRGFADAVISKEGLTAVRNKAGLFDHIFNLMNPTGKLVFTDLFLTGDDPECPEVAVWSAMEHRPMHLINPGRFRDRLFDLGFEMPRMDTITDVYLEGIRKAFARAPEIISAAGERAPLIQPALVREAEYWSRRTTLLESGEAQVCLVEASIDRGSDLIR